MRRDADLLSLDPLASAFLGKPWQAEIPLSSPVKLT